MTTQPNTPDETALQPVSDIPEDWLSAPAKLFTTLEPADTIKAINNAEPLESHLGETLKVTGLVIHEVTIVTEAGEIVVAPRTVLAAKGGKYYAATSRGVLQGLRLMMQAFGNPPWPDGLSLKVEAIRTRKGFRTFKVTPV